MIPLNPRATLGARILQQRRKPSQITRCPLWTVSKKYIRRSGFCCRGLPLLTVRPRSSSRADRRAARDLHLLLTPMLLPAAMAYVPPGNSAEVACNRAVVRIAGLEQCAMWRL